MFNSCRARLGVKDYFPEPPLPNQEGRSSSCFSSPSVFHAAPVQKGTDGTAGTHSVIESDCSPPRIPSAAQPNQDASDHHGDGLIESWEAAQRLLIELRGSRNPISTPKRR